MDPEENLFDSQSDHDDNDYDQDDSIVDVDQNMIFDLPEKPAADDKAPAADKTGDDKDEDDNEDDDLFKTDDKPEDENEDTISEAELAAFNKKLGTNFKDGDELKKHFQKAESETEEQQENTLLLQNQKNIEACDRYLGLDDEDLVREQLLAEALQAKKDVNDEEVIAEIEEKIDGLKQIKELSKQAGLIRANVKNAKEKAEGVVNGITGKRKQKEQATAAKNTEELQNAIADLFNQKEYLGVVLEKNVMTEIYNDIRTKKFAERVNKDQRLLAKFALLERFEDVISKKVAEPTRGDNVRQFFAGQNGKSSGNNRSVATASSTGSTGRLDENTQAFLK